MTLRGRKKGGGSSPSESPDTLRSTQIAEVVLLVGEGEVRGLVNGMKSVYLDGVPVENQDGTRNFDAFDFAYNVGTPGQAALPGLSGVQAEVGVGQEVRQAIPVLRTIVDPGADELRVTIGVPALTELKPDSGNLVGSSFEWAVDVQSSGGGFVERYRGTVTGKATSRYNRSVRVPLTGTGPWDVRVRRVSPDATSSAITNAFAWDSFTVVKTVKLRYPHSAVALMRVNAQSFGRIPTIALDLMGQLVPVPTNYNPLTKVYTGTWDGTFRLDWTDNPAWIFHDVLTHPRYGLGAFVSPALANKWALYQIAQYCDGLVSNGRGGTEPRFTCNAVINTQSEAFNLLQELATVFRGMSFWANSAVDFSQDAPGEAELLYTPANVVDGDFQYADTNGEKQLHSSFLVRYNDLQQLGRQAVEPYTDPELVQRFGVRTLELTAFGCWSRSQAARVGRWAAYSEQYESEVVSFSVGADGAAAKPGKLFKIADPNEAGERLGGRIRQATASAVTLDAAVTLREGETYVLSVLQPAAAQGVGLVAERRTVTTAAGQRQVLQVAPPFSAAPAAQTVWLLESSEIEATWWRCMAVEPGKGAGGKTEYRINGVRHRPEKFAFVEQGLRMDPKPISRLSLTPARPGPLQITETPYRVDTAWRIRVSVGWPAAAGGLRYRLAWRLDSGPWTDVPETSANLVDIEGLVPGFLEVQLAAVNALENVSPVVKGSRLLSGSAVRPGNVADLAATKGGGFITWLWTPNSAPDYQYTTVKLGGGSFEEGALLFSGRADRCVQRVTVVGSYTVRARHTNSAGLESAGTASLTVVVTEADLLVAPQGPTGPAGPQGPTGAPGSPGAPGAVGTQAAVLYLYQWTAGSVPEAPSGTSLYTWATAAHTAYGGAGGWSVTVPENPSVPGARLWVASKGASDSALASSTTVSWASGYTVAAWAGNGAPGQPGAPGIKAATPTVYRWAASIPTISGSSLYTWASASIDVAPAAWSALPGSGSPGQTLFGASVQLVDAAGAATSAVDWATASITARGYAGLNGAPGSPGSPGSPGTPGISARRAYTLTTSTSLGSGTVTTSGISSLPPANTVFGSGLTWSAQPGVPGVGQTLYQSDGLYYPTSDQVVWETPYISSLKVGNLSALAVNTGNLTVTGQVVVGAGGDIRSSNFEAGVGGYYFGPSVAQLPATAILGRLTVGQVPSLGSLGFAGDLNATFGAPAGSPVQGIFPGGASAASVEGAAASAVAGLALRLRNDSRNVLAGGAGIAVGSIDWNAIGAYTGGAGVAITSAGILGHDGTNAVFVLSAAGLAVRGDITGSTGTFTGTVRVGDAAVSGTTMAGSGAVLNASGAFALGTPSRNIAFNGTDAPRLNGAWVSDGNLALSVFGVTVDIASIMIFPPDSNPASALGPTATASGGTAPYVYEWSINSVYDEPFGTGNAWIGGTSNGGRYAAPVVQISVSNGSVSAVMTCSVRDANGRTATVNVGLGGQRGLPP